MPVLLWFLPLLIVAVPPAASSFTFDIDTKGRQIVVTINCSRACAHFDIYGARIAAGVVKQQSGGNDGRCSLSAIVGFAPTIAAAPRAVVYKSAANLLGGRYDVCVGATSATWMNTLWGDFGICRVACHRGTAACVAGAPARRFGSSNCSAPSYACRTVAISESQSPAARPACSSVAPATAASSTAGQWLSSASSPPHVPYAAAGKVWAPTSCELQVFTQQALLGALRDKRVLFLGDSTQEELGVELVSMLHNYADMGFRRPVRVYSLPRHNITIAVATYGLECEGLMGAVRQCSASGLCSRNQSWDIAVIGHHHDLAHIVHSTTGGGSELVAHFERDFKAARKILETISRAVFFRSMHAPSALSRCDVFAEPRVAAFNAVMETLTLPPFYFNSFLMTAGTNCGDIHKGFRFWKSTGPSGKGYNGHEVYYITQALMNQLSQAGVLSPL